MSRGAPLGPPCPYCNATATARNGTGRSGKPTYRCPECGRRNTDGVAGRAGRPQGDDPSPEAIRARRYRERRRAAGP